MPCGDENMIKGAYITLCPALEKYFNGIKKEPYIFFFQLRCKLHLLVFTT